MSITGTGRRGVRERRAEEVGKLPWYMLPRYMLPRYRMAAPLQLGEDGRRDLPRYRGTVPLQLGEVGRRELPLLRKIKSKSNDSSWDDSHEMQVTHTQGDTNLKRLHVPSSAYKDILSESYR